MARRAVPIRFIIVIVAAPVAVVVPVIVVVIVSAPVLTVIALVFVPFAVVRVGERPDCDAERRCEDGVDDFSFHGLDYALLYRMRNLPFTASAAPSPRTQPPHRSRSAR